MFTKGFVKIAITLNKATRLVAGGISSRTGLSRRGYYKLHMKDLHDKWSSSIPGLKIKDTIRQSKLMTTHKINKQTGGKLMDLVSGINNDVKKK